MNVKFRLGLLCLFFVQFVAAQNTDQVSNYINKYKFLAIAEMQRSGVPASIILAQGIHETQAGTSDLVISSNNHFGIKCKTGWNGQVVYHDDDTRSECFRSYSTAEESYRDHSDYLSQTPRYAFLFKLNPEDYEAWAYGLKKAGYATNIKYSQILIKFIEDYGLQKYSLMAMGKIPPEQPADRMLANTPGAPSDSGQVRSAAPVSYPDGPFTINEAKVIYVRAGVSLLSLSGRYDIPLSHLLDFNDMNQEDILNNDQLIFLQRKRRVGDIPFHIVQPGESMYSICQAQGIRYESLMEYNRLKPGEEPAPGEKIYLQTPATNKPVLRNTGSVGTAIPSS